MLKDMNGEAIYDSATQRWRPPSPKTTPQSSKFVFYPYHTPGAIGHSPNQSYNWMSSGTPLATPIDQTQNNHGRHTLSRQRAQPHELNIPNSGFVHSSLQCSQPDFISGSFVEQLNSTSLDDPFTDGRAMTSSTPAGGMRTPPPTRDDSSRRKAYQPRLVEFQTPSTIASRRMSVPHEPWHGQPENAYPAPSPFSFTPLQFSPPAQFGFAPSGPMTAPVYSHSGIFWEPNSNHSMNQMSFSTIAEDPYGQSFDMQVGNPASHFVVGSTAPPNHRISTSENIKAPNATTQVAPRPQSARAADSTAMSAQQKASLDSLTTGVNPNMLWNTSISDTASTLAESTSSNHADERQTWQPYQHQLESLRREKEESMRKSRGSFGSHSVEAPSQRAQSGLHRSLTDSRLRKSGFHRSASSSQATSTDETNHLFPSHTANVHRASSPLKRHRSTSQADQLTPTKTRARRSVVLTVDEQGHARTEVKQLARDEASAPVFNANRSQDGFSDSDISDSISRLPLATSSAEPSTGSSDAQNALREVVWNRRMSRKSDINRQFFQGSEGHLPQAAGSTHNNNNNSPTTITDPEFHTPSTDRNADSAGNTRCVCNGRAPEDRSNLMIECESCKNWLHVACLGLTPEQLPQVFVCVFCTGWTPATRGGRIRTHSNSNIQL